MSLPFHFAVREYLCTSRRQEYGPLARGVSAKIFLHLHIETLFCPFLWHVNIFQ